MNKKAQSTMEYAILACVIVAAVGAMLVYIKRGFQGSMNNNAGQISGGGFYSPGATNSNSTIIKSAQEQSDSYSTDDPNISDAKINTTVSTLNNARTTDKTEEVLPFEKEPQR